MRPAPPVAATCTPSRSQSRWLLPFLFAHWLLVLLAAILGLRCGGRGWCGAAG